MSLLDEIVRQVGEVAQNSQGVGDQIDGTYTIFFEQKSSVPRGKKMTYGRLVCNIKENKSETHRTRLRVGGNLLDLPGLLSNPTATVTTMKCLFNSFISTLGAKYLVADVNNFLGDNMKVKFHIFGIWEVIVQVEIFEVSDETFISRCRNYTVEQCHLYTWS